MKDAMIQVKTADLTGLALDYATGIADRRELELPSGVLGRTSVVWCDPFTIKREGRPDFHDKTRRLWKPSTDWCNGGPLIDKHMLHIKPHCTENGVVKSWAAGMTWPCDTMPSQCGKTPLIAACRAIVMKELGAVVSVPKELMP